MKKLRIARQMLKLALTVTSMVIVSLLVWPAVSHAQEPSQPTETQVKPLGSAEADISIWLPRDSVTTEFVARADYVAEEALPDGITYPPQAVGQAFTFGLWGGDGTTLTDFNPSIVISKKYSDENVPTASAADEELVQLMMYDPTSESWLKLCSSVNIHENFVAAALTSPTPLDGKGSSLMVLAIDETPALDQAVDKDGSTAISVQGSNLGFQVLVDTVEVGTHFAVTMLPSQAGGRAVKLFSKPVDIKGCQIDHDNPGQNTLQLNIYPKALRVGFNYDADTLSRAGGPSNLTIVNNRDARWLDLEEVGSRVIRGDEAISVDTRRLGTFGLAAR